MLYNWHADGKAFHHSSHPLGLSIGLSDGILSVRPTGAAPTDRPTVLYHGNGDDGDGLRKKGKPSTTAAFTVSPCSEEKGGWGGDSSRGNGWW